jgi:hypothetical protein
VSELERGNRSGWVQKIVDEHVCPLLLSRGEETNSPPKRASDGGPRNGCWRGDCQTNVPRVELGRRYVVMYC